MILAFVLLGAMVNTSAELPLRCATNARVTHAIAELGKLRSDIGDPLAVLLSDPVIAACHLVWSLHVVNETHVAGYQQDKHPKTMRVIWALRALRYLTHCQDFRAPTAENPRNWDEMRRGFLLRDDDIHTPAKTWKPSDGVPFFATWMSRDSVFIAPRDAQQKIIMQWVRW